MYITCTYMYIYIIYLFSLCTCVWYTYKYSRRQKNVSVYLSVERLYFNRSTDRTTVKTKTVRKRLHLKNGQSTVRERLIVRKKTAVKVRNRAVAEIPRASLLHKRLIPKARARERLRVMYSTYKRQRILFYHHQGLRAPAICRRLVLGKAYERL